MSGVEELKADLIGIAKAIAENTFQVPKNQRSYAWEEEHVRELFDDLAGAIARKEPHYFLGAVVVAAREGLSAEVVDGQQRLATTTILLAAIRDYFITQNDNDRSSEIERSYLMARDLRTTNILPKLRLNSVDHEFFQGHVLSTPGAPDRSVAPTRDSHRRIASAAKIAREHVNRLTKATNPTSVLVDWIDHLVSRAKVILFRVPTHTNAYMIFETLNDRGLDLSTTDLLKNHLFGLSGDRLNEVEYNWTKMQATLQASGDEETAKTFIRHLWSSLNGPTRDRVLFDEVKRDLKTKAAAVNFSTKLATGASMYAAILSPSHDFWAAHTSSAKSHLETLRLLRMEQFRPLLLAILASFSKPDIEKSLRFLVAASVRFLIVGGLGGGTMERHYSENAREISNGNIKTAKDLFSKLTTAVPNDKEFQAAFEGARVSQHYLARYYLRALEQHAANMAEPEWVPNDNENQLTLEHILPENPSSAWAVAPEDAAAVYNRIGNLMLLGKTPNSNAGNISFTEKKKYYKGTKLNLNRSVLRAKKWDLAAIETRQKDMAKLAVVTWSLK
jgi:hypothetical protein